MKRNWLVIVSCLECLLKTRIWKIWWQNLSNDDMYKQNVLCLPSDERSTNKSWISWQCGHYLEISVSGECFLQILAPSSDASYLNCGQYEVTFDWEAVNRDRKSRGAQGAGPGRAATNSWWRVTVSSEDWFEARKYDPITRQIVRNTLNYANSLLRSTAKFTYLERFRQITFLFTRNCLYQENSWLTRAVSNCSVFRLFKRLFHEPFGPDYCLFTVWSIEEEENWDENLVKSCSFSIFFRQNNCWWLICE